MRVEGIYNNNGKSTLYVSHEPESYYNDQANGRIFQGRFVKSLYIGSYDISNLKVGSIIEIYYGEPKSTKNGTYAPVKKIEVIK